MDPEKEMYHVLCASGSEKGRSFIKELLPAEAVEKYLTADTARAAIATVKTQRVDLCFINAPLPDGDAAALAKRVAEEFGAAVLLFVRAEEYPAAVDLTAQSGVFTVEKPNTRRFFDRAVDLMLAVKRREKVNEQKLRQLENKLTELKLVDRAKLVLMQTLKMDESKAHRYIEKQAMDRRITRREVAEIILSTYEP